MVVAAVLVPTAALVAGVLANPSGNDSTLPNWFLFTIPLQTGLAAYVAIRSLERRAAAQSQDESRADGR